MSAGAASESAGGLFQDRVRERDLDNFLVEELQSSDDFRAWLLARVAGVFSPPAAQDVRLGKSPQRLQDNRQTDVRMGWFNDEDELTACVLIESKVTADFQVGQAESYAAELGEWRAALGAAGACAVLVAPAARLATLAGKEAFDDCLPIEEIVAFLQGRLKQPGLVAELSRRIEVRVALLEALCGKRASAWTAFSLPEKQEFTAQYVELARKIVPNLRVRETSDGPKAITKFFEGAKLPAAFPTMRIKHEFGQPGGGEKYVNLQFDGLAGSLDALVASGLANRPGLSVLTSGKSLFVRKATPGIDPRAPFDAQRRRVEEGLEGIREITAWVEAHAIEIKDVLARGGNGVETAK